MVVITMVLSVDEIELSGDLLKIIIIIIISFWKPYCSTQIIILHRKTGWIELLMLNSNTWHHLTIVCKQMININLNY